MTIGISTQPINLINMDKNLQTRYCTECGSSDVSSMAWVNNATGEIEEYIGYDKDPEYNFCHHCNCSVAIMTLETMWKHFSEIPIDAEDCIETDFLFFEKGTDRNHIWHWFDERCPNGLAVDLMGEQPKQQ